MRLWLIQLWHWPYIFILTQCFSWTLTLWVKSVASGPHPPHPGPYFHPSHGLDGLHSAQDVYRITLLSQKREFARLQIWEAALTTEIFVCVCFKSSPRLTVLYDKLFFMLFQIISLNIAAQCRSWGELSISVCLYCSLLNLHNVLIVCWRESGSAWGAWDSTGIRLTC